MPHKLLLADDSVTIQRVIELTFADEDVQVLAVGDGKQAIARVLSDRPDIVLADVGMPERNGYEVAEFIKGDPQLAHIPVLLLTGAFEPIDEARARAVGCDGVLVKPFEPQMVINRVKDLLAGRPAPGGSIAAAATPAPLSQPFAGGSTSAGAAGALAQPAAVSGSLEDYFDRLDAAFANLDAGSPPAAAAGDLTPSRPADTPPAALTAAAAPFLAADDLAGWDPDLAGDPERPASFETQPSAAEPARPIVPSVAPVPATSRMEAPPVPAAPVERPAPSVPVPSLAEAFAALLSAEQAHPIAPSQVRPGMLSDDVIDDVVRRVTERLNDGAMRDTVVEVAERLVRAEIARIKGA